MENQEIKVCNNGKEIVVVTLNGIESERLPGYVWDDGKGFCKEYGKKPAHYETWLVRFRYDCDPYCAILYTRCEDAVPDKVKVWQVLGQLMVDVDISFSDIIEIYNVADDRYFEKADLAA